MITFDLVQNNNKTATLKKIKLYIATSLNGKIAKKDGSVDWLEAIPNPDKLDYGYAAFNETIDTTIQGYSTYAQILGWDIPFPYPNTKNYVLTRKQEIANTEHVEFIKENHTGFIEKLKAEEGKDIWLIGGGQINTMLLNAGLIDEIQVFVMPIVLTEGIELFELLPNETHLKLINSTTFPTGVIELKYQILETGT